MSNEYKLGERKVRSGVFPGDPKRPADGYPVLRNGEEVAFIIGPYRGAWSASVNGSYWSFSTRKQALESIIEQLEGR